MTPAETHEPVPGDPHVQQTAEQLAILAATARGEAARLGAAVAVADVASRQADRDIAVAGQLGALTANVQTLTAMAATHGAVLIEVRDQVMATNGRLGQVETTVQEHKALLALVSQAMQDRDAVARFLASWRGKVAIAGVSLGGLTAVAASIRMLVAP